MIHRPLTLPATAWEGGARPPKTMIGGPWPDIAPPPWIRQCNSTQPVCIVSTVYRHQRPDHLLNYHEYQRYSSMLRMDLKKM